MTEKIAKCVMVLGTPSGAGQGVARPELESQAIKSSYQIRLLVA